MQPGLSPAVIMLRRRFAAESEALQRGDLQHKVLKLPERRSTLKRICSQYGEAVYEDVLATNSLAPPGILDASRKEEERSVLFGEPWAVRQFMDLAAEAAHLFLSAPAPEPRKRIPGLLRDFDDVGTPRMPRADWQAPLIPFRGGIVYYIAIDTHAPWITYLYWSLMAPRSRWVARARGELSLVPNLFEASLLVIDRLTGQSPGDRSGDGQVPKKRAHWLSANEAMKEIGRARGTITKMVKRGELIGEHEGRYLYIDPESVWAWKGKHLSQTSPTPVPSAPASSTGRAGMSGGQWRKCWNCETLVFSTAEVPKVCPKCGKEALIRG